MKSSIAASYPFVDGPHFPALYMSSPPNTPAPSAGERPLRHSSGAFYDMDPAAQIYPRLTILRQTSPTQERVSQNGIQKDVHVVVKNTPFLLQLGLTGPLVINAGGTNTTLDFKHLFVDLSLLYDNASLKAVSFVKAKPCDFKATVSERGDQLGLNIKIKVLTSQHEDMFFRVKVRLLDPKTKREFSPPLEVVSAPIKVISKPKQARKKKATKRRSLNDMLVEAVQRIEEQQEMQQRVLQHVLSRKRKSPDNDSCGSTSPLSILPHHQPAQMDDPSGKIPLGFARPSTSWGSPSTGAQFGTTTTTTTITTTATGMSVLTSGSPSSSGSSQPSAEVEFAVALRQFVASYEQLPQEQRPTKIRRVLRNVTSTETEQLSTLLECLTSRRGCGADDPDHDEEECKKLGSLLATAGGEDCACPSCPHKLELERIDEFYRDFLATDMPLESLCDVDFTGGGGGASSNNNKMTQMAT